MTTILKVPSDIIGLIYQSLKDPKDRASLARTCKRMLAIYERNVTYKRIADHRPHLREIHELRGQRNLLQTQLSKLQSTGEVVTLCAGICCCGISCVTTQVFCVAVNCSCSCCAISILAKTILGWTGLGTFGCGAINFVATGIQNCCNKRMHGEANRVRSEYHKLNSTIQKNQKELPARLQMNEEVSYQTREAYPLISTQ